VCRDRTGKDRLDVSIAASSEHLHVANSAASHQALSA
jgi:hypothetical protein